MVQIRSTTVYKVSALYAPARMFEDNDISKSEKLVQILNNSSTEWMLEVHDIFPLLVTNTPFISHSSSLTDESNK